MDTRRPVRASRVLLVDGHPDSAESMARVLALWGYQALVAFDGLTGLEIALARRPDVVVLEIRLPRMDGHEVAQQLPRAGRVGRPGGPGLWALTRLANLPVSDSLSGGPTWARHMPAS